MATAAVLLDMLGRAALQLVTGPFYYIAVLFIILQYTRGMAMERQMFAVKLHDWKTLTLKAVGAGLLIGVAVSLAGAFVGASLTPEAILWLWGAALLLMLLRIRYLCFAYGAGAIALLQWLLGFLALEERSDWIGSAAASLASIDAAGLLLLVALLHLAEALLVRLQGDRLATPMFLEGKRGKLVGGYLLQGFWPVPLFLLVPAAEGSAHSALWSWPTLLGGSGQQAWTIAALPMIIGFTEMTRSLLPREKAKHAAQGLLLFSVILGAAAAAAWLVPWLLPLAAIVSIGLHEVMIWRSRMKEASRTSLYVHDARGLRILGVVPGTPAEAMGLAAGEVLYKVNGKRVWTKEELYEALVQNPAFCKLEVYNNAGELKFAQRARYEGEHHQLGVILAPDEQANYYAASGPASLLELLRRRRTANKRGSGGAGNSASAPREALGEERG